MERKRSEIAEMFTETFEDHAIPLANCRAQGYDNVASMAGKCNGAQSIIKEQYPTAISYSCRCHTLYLCGNDAAECTPGTITYFETMQTICKLFSCNPMMWKVLARRIGCSLYGVPGTRWSDRVESVRLLAAHLLRVN